MAQELCPHVSLPTELREGALLQSKASCLSVSSVLHHYYFFPSPMFLHQLLKSQRSFLLDLVMLTLSGKARNQICSCLQLDSSLKFLWNNLGLRLWPATWNCFLNNITKIWVFLVVFLPVSWGHLSLFLDIFRFWVPSVWSIDFSKQWLLCTLKYRLLFANTMVHVTLLSYLYACIYPIG